MRIITVTSQQEVTALVHQVFTVPTSSPRRVADAVQALIDANPHLGGITNIPAGTPIVVPDLSDVAPKVAAGSIDSTFQDFRAQVRQALDDARSSWADSAKLAGQNAKASLEVLRGADFRRLAGVANLKVGPLMERVNQAAKDAEARSKVELKNVEALGDALDEFVKAIGAMTGLRQQ